MEPFAALFMFLSWGSVLCLLAFCLKKFKGGPE